MRRILPPLLLAAACSGGAKHTQGGGGGDPDGIGDGARTGPDPEPVDRHRAARERYENPGGMWMPRQMSDHAALLRELGLRIDASALTDPTQAPMSAVVSLGHCTASFVSPEGLLVTNHHCVQGALQLSSTPDNNLVEHGFVAKTRADETSAGPTQRVYVAQRMTDVTDAILAGIADITDDGRRHAEIETREKALIAACELDRPEITCKTASFFKGHEWQLIEYLEIRDVRLVYVPARSVGNYGGEIDNWQWPRHTGDFAFYRAYVGPDGQPAGYSPDNVPFKPQAFLPIGAAGVDASDLVFVAGYPAKTNRMLTAAEIRRNIDWTYPRYLDKANQRMAIIAEQMKAGGETAIKAGVARQSIQNGLEKYTGILEGLQQSDLVDRRDAEEQAFRTWAAADPARRRHVDALDAIGARLPERWDLDARDEAWNDVIGTANPLTEDRRDLIGGSRLLKEAIFLVHHAEQRQKPDAERRLGYQDRDRPAIVAVQRAFAKRYDAAIDRAMWTLALTRAAADPASVAWLRDLLGLKKGAKVDAAAIARALDALYGKTKLADEKVRMTLLDASPATLKKSKDPFIKLALKLYPRVKQHQARDEARHGAELATDRVYAEGLLAFRAGKVAPDANRTLRISFGTVRGYRPAPGADVYAPFTVAPEIAKKHTGEEPFDAPRKLLDAIAAGAWGPYASRELGAVPVNFLADLDSTGGNSGSPVLNAAGELVGLLFDGNFEGLASDVVFKPDTTRAIVADIRYVLWVADAIDGADHVLEELGIPPSL
jgi:hypothetical protein